MTAPRFLVDPGGLDGLTRGSPFVLSGEEGRHAAAVRRIRPGEQVDVADGAGVIARCTVTGAGKASLDLEVRDVARDPGPRLRFTLVQALAKGGRDEQAVESATEAGVDVVIPWQAERSVVRWQGERGEKARRRWVATARQAAKQSRRSWVPAVEDAVGTDALAARIGAATLAVVLHEDAAAPIVGVQLPAEGEVLIVVGPEGGIGEAELGALTGAGAVPVRLGREVLRTSTAGTVALAWLAGASGRWS